MDPLRFGPLDDARSRWVAEGVVSGISGYGNSVGVPTVGGEVVFDACYAGNPLVNVLCLGILPHERLVLGQASGVGNLAVLLGSATGRDGIGGVSVLASAGFEEGDDDKRPSVQVGDPFEEKRLIEACLALLDAGLVVGIQDLGGAGLTCATSETASRGGVGHGRRRLGGAVPRAGHGAVRGDDEREPGADARHRHARGPRRGARPLRPVGGAGHGHRPGHRGGFAARRAAAHPRRVRRAGPRRRARGQPPRRRPALRPAPRAARPGPARPVAGRRLRSVRRRAALARPAVRHARGSGASTTTSSSSTRSRARAATPCCCASSTRSPGPTPAAGWPSPPTATTAGARVDPQAGTGLVVAESVLNLACVGARPIAVVNCLNFGNPEHPEVMWQLSEAIDGMAEACRAFGLPVIGGNVSLYNETARHRHRPDAGGRRARRGRPARPPPAGVRPGRRRPRAAGRADAVGRRPGRLRVGLAPGAAGRRPARPRQRRPHRGGRARARPRGRRRGVRGARRRHRRRWRVALAEMAVAAAGVGAQVDVPARRAVRARRPRGSCSSVPDGRAWPRCGRRAGALGVDGRPTSGAAGGDRLSVDGLLDLAARPRWSTPGATACRPPSAPASPRAELAASLSIAGPRWSIEGR